MNKIGWIIFSAAVVLLLGGLIAYTRITNPALDVKGINSDVVLAASEQSGNIADHIKGKVDSKVVLVEYGDFQCPSCGEAHPNVNLLMGEYGDRIALVFRNFPLTSMHPNARAAAATAEAAGLQGKYWEMHDLLYTNQGSWSSLDTQKRTDTFTGLASQLGLNLDTFKTDLVNTKITKKIAFDIAIAKAKAVTATPTFFLNGEKLDDATASGIVKGDLTAIKAKIDKLLAK